MNRVLFSLAVMSACDSEQKFETPDDEPTIEPTVPPPTIPETTTVDTGWTEDSGTPPTEPEPEVCAIVDPEVCGNGTDDDGDGTIDCEIQGWGDDRFGSLVVADAGWLFAPGDLDGDGFDTLIGFNAIDVPLFRTGVTVVDGPFLADESEPVPDLTVVAQGYTGTRPVADRDFDGDGVLDLVLPMVLEFGWVCDNPLAWEVYVMPLDLDGNLDARDNAVGILRPPESWTNIGPSVYVSAVGDVNHNGTEDVVVHTSTCVEQIQYWVDGADLVGEHDVSQVAFAILPDQPNVIPTGAVEVGDVNGDGNDDFGIVVQQVPAYTSRLLVFTDPPSGVIDLATAAYVFVPPPGDTFIENVLPGHDLTGDGISDLVLSVALDGGGVFVVEVPPPLGELALETDAWSYYDAAGAGSLSAQVSDLNGDGWDDLAIGVWNDGMHIDYEPCPGPQPLPADGFPELYANNFVLADATGDGWDDVVVSIESGNGGGMAIHAAGPAD